MNDNDIFVPKNSIPMKKNNAKDTIAFTIRRVFFTCNCDFFRGFWISSLNT